MNICVKIYEEDGNTESKHFSVKGSIKAEVTSCGLKEDEAIYLEKITLTNELLLQACKLYDVKYGQICIDYDISDGDKWLFGDEFFGNYNGTAIEWEI